MFPHEDSLSPIYLWRRTEEHPEQVGTGIYIKMLENGYLLTAGHVVDLRSEGALCIPTIDGISPLEGGIGGNALRPGEERGSDKYDVAYIRLSNKTTAAAHPVLQPLARQSVDIEGHVLPGDFCSVGGHPITQANRTETSYESAAYSFVGIAADHAEYIRLGYDPHVHLVVKYCIKKAIFPEGDRTNPPHPRGLSGGGIFRLHPDFLLAPEQAPRRLVGSMHTYLRRENCFIGVRVPAHLHLIAQRFPDEVRAFTDDGSH